MIDYDYSEDFAKEQSEKVPKQIAWLPKITTEELIDLANMTHEEIENAINNYLKTWKIEEKYKFIITDELIAIVKEKNAIVKRLKEAERRWKEIKREWEEIKREWEEIKREWEEIRKKSKRLDGLNKKFDNLIKWTKSILKKWWVAP